ncbi:hypothetical protein FRB99_001631 [Tulasnella sp. 403]|nr:hypothetical protein FRB99_001631 [Tulasnella sp. 403]
MSPTRLRLSIDRHSDDSHDNAMFTTAPAANRVYIDSQGRPHDPDFISHIFAHPNHELLAARRRAKGKAARRLSQTGLIQDFDSDDDIDSDDDLRSSSNTPPDPFRTYSNRRSAQSYYSPTSSMAHTQSASTTSQPCAEDVVPAIAKSSPFPSTPAAYKAYQQRRARYTTPTTTARPTSVCSSQTNTYNYSYASGQHSNSPTSWRHTASLLTPAADDDEPTSTTSSPVSDRWSLRRWSRSSPKPDLDDLPEWAEKSPRRVLRKRRTEVLSELNEDDASVNQHITEEQEDCVPSCTEALRRQWQTLVLRVTLSTHRAKRRLSPRRRRDSQNSYSEKIGT